MCLLKIRKDSGLKRNIRDFPKALLFLQVFVSVGLGIVGGLCLLAVQSISLFGIAFLFGIFFFVISGVIMFVSFGDCDYVFNSVAQVASVCYVSSIISLFILCINIK